MTSPFHSLFTELSAVAGDPEKSLVLLLTRIRDELELDRVSVGICRSSGAGTEILVLGEVGDPAPFIRPASERNTDRCLVDSPKPLPPDVVVGELDKLSPPSPLADQLVEAGFRSLATFALHLEGQPVGTLYALSRRPDFFGEETTRHIQSYLHPVAVVSNHLLLFRRHRRQSHFLAISQELTARVSSVHGLRDTCRQISRHAAELFQVDRTAIYLSNDDSSWVTCEAFTEWSEEEEQDLLPSLNVAETPMVHAALEGIPISRELSWGPLDLPPIMRERLHLDGEGTLLIVPLMLGKAPLGLMFCQSKRPGPLVSEDEMESIRLLGRQLGLIVHSRQMVDVQEQGMRNFAGLLGMSHAVSSLSDLSQIPTLIARHARDLCEADEATCFVVEPDGVTLRPVVCLGMYADQVLKVRIKIGEGITGTVAANRRGEINNHAETDPRSVTIPDTPLEPEAILSVPLISANRLIGVLTLHKLEGRSFEPVDLATMEIFAAQAATAIDNARLLADLREERVRLLTMLENMEEAVVFADREGMVLLLNEAARKILGAGEEHTGRSVFDLLAQAEELAEVRESLIQVHEGVTRNTTLEQTLRGRTYICSVTRVPDERGDSWGEVLLFKDVTDLKVIELQLLQSSKMSAVGQLAAGVAHEFNNLIAAIYGYAQFMKEHTDPAMLHRGLDVILNSSERARELTASLLTFSRRRPGRREPVDVNQLLTDTLLLLARQLERSHIQVKRDLAEVPPTVADAGRLQQVFLDLITNAQQAMTEGGNLTVTSRVQGGVIEIRVADDGPGIPPEHLDRIFEPFFTTKGALGGAKVPGTGLGLSTAYNVLRDHGGSLRVQSEPGEGACFVVTLPVRSLETRREIKARVGVPKSLDRTGRIMILDADETLRALMAEILQGLGHQVRQAEGGEEALDIIRDWPCDLLIADRMAPGMDTMASYERLRRTHPDLPVVFVTSRDGGAKLEAEGDPWMFRINKPFRNRDLVALVSRILSQRLEKAS
jgi:PAS domain S-box-containing protein